MARSRVATAALALRQNERKLPIEAGGHDSHQDSALHEETGMQAIRACAGNGVRHSVFREADLMTRRGLRW